jgi:hypothetical protein
MSLSAVDTRSSVSNRRVATNCSAGGITSFLEGLAAIRRPRSSVQPAIWITAASSEVSLRSAATAGRFELVLPDTRG